MTTFNQEHCRTRTIAANIQRAYKAIDCAISYGDLSCTLFVPGPLIDAIKEDLSSDGLTVFKLEVCNCHKHLSNEHLGTEIEIRW